MAKNAFDKKAKKYACFTVEQQKAFEQLNPRQRAYVEYRGNGGYNKTTAYIRAGFKATNASQSSYLLERKNAIIPELVAALQGQYKLRTLTEEDSQINQEITALASAQSADELNKIIEDGDVEKARQVKFYRDIIAGIIQTVRVTKRLNGEGKLLEKKIEKVSDVDAKMKARKELDRILGLNQSIDVGQLQLGGITVNIVDSAKHEELEDSRNTIKLDPDDVQIIDGEQSLVVEQKDEVEKKQVVETIVEKE